MIECECGVLIYREGNIEDNSRDEHPIDKRNREEVPNVRRDDVFPARELHGFVLFLELFQEYDLFLLKIKSILLREMIIFFSEVVVEALDLGEDIADSIFHMRGLVARTDNHLRMTEYAIPECVSSLELLDDLALVSWHLSHNIVTIWVDFRTE